MQNNTPIFGQRPGEGPATVTEPVSRGADSIPCHVLGLKIAKSAVDFEDSLAEYMHCQCLMVKRLLCSDQDEKVLPMLKSFRDNLEQVCCIETQLLEKLDKGLHLSNCDIEEG